MQPAESLDKFTEFAAASGIQIRQCKAREGFQQMFSFCELIKPVGCEGFGGDMLLFQWGTYDWGLGKSFQLNITRQFVESELEHDDAVSQLSLTFKFEPSAEFDTLGAGNSWDDEPVAFENFSGFVFSSAPFIAVADKLPIEVDLNYSYV
jgi:hypothetical protein